MEVDRSKLQQNLERNLIDACNTSYTHRKTGKNSNQSDFPGRVSAIPEFPYEI
jgi:hypothetical protein